MPADNITQIEVGQTHSRTVAIGADAIDRFSALTGDDAPVHMDDAFARAQGYQGRIAHGLLVGSYYSTILGCDLPGPRTVIAKMSLDMVAPVYAGDTLDYTARVDKISASVRAVQLILSASNQHGTVVSRGTAMCIFKQEPA